ncbi:YtzI protein [Bacillus suaedaesalsae]|uniref:YtzI protein n=1 Tax=Bacillus suaedaesalsae TaxID=2810349 RepID=A0ABS2DD09_9BACI|nr:YtzI protein [Bacillus suaedaesalsae]MBM6616351.1 YtzI protein [Bacillus suaedaesalsae]
MYTILIISIIVVIIILLLSVITINKGYAYKQTIDQLDDNPYLKEQTELTESGEKKRVEEE